MSHPSRAPSRLVAVPVAVLVLGACFDSDPPRGPAVPEPERRPNVLVILTDDQRPDTLRVMPQTQRWFAQEGTRYPNAYATTPVCCPSRASIMSGRYAHNHGVLTNERSLTFDEGASLARHLQVQGYFTAMAGKYLNMWPVDRAPAHYDRWAHIPDVPYGNVYYDFRVNLDGEVKETLGAYSTIFIADTAVDFLEDFERSDDDRPWFLFLNPYAPHQPANPESKYADSRVRFYRGNPSVFEKDRSDKPPRVQDAPPARLEQVRYARSKQIRSLRSADDLVDRVMSKLRLLGEDGDTLAFFLSDNGYMWGEHQLKSKRWQYLPSIRIPMLARWPGHIEAGARDPRIVANIDIAPTVLDALGVWPHELYAMDGRSILDSGGRDRLLLENWYFDRGAGTWAATLTPDFHYVESYDDSGETLEFREYYDLKRDPWELRNLLGDGVSSNDPAAAALARQLAADRSCRLDACP